MNNKTITVYCIYNAIKTPDGTILLCEKGDDYKRHDDSISGEAYTNEGLGFRIDRSDNVVPFEDLKILNTDPHEKIRNVKFWNSYGKSGKDPEKKMCVAEMENDHIEAILSTQKRIVGKLDHIFFNELVFRKQELLKEIQDLCEKDKKDVLTQRKIKL